VVATPNHQWSFSHAGEAFQLAKQAGNKVAEGIREVGNKLLPQGEVRRGDEGRSGGVYTRGSRDPYGSNTPAGLDPFGGLFGRAGTIDHPFKKVNPLPAFILQHSGNFSVWLRTSCKDRNPGRWSYYVWGEGLLTQSVSRKEQYWLLARHAFYEAGSTVGCVGWLECQIKSLPQGRMSWSNLLRRVTMQLVGCWAA